METSSEVLVRPKSTVLKAIFAIALLSLLSVDVVFAQRERDEKATIIGFKGIQYTSPDSTFYTNFRFRMQNRLKYTSLSGDELGDGSFEARIRRMRLRMDGYIYNPKLTYSIQLAFTRGDQDFDDTGIANIVRDAVVFYNFTKNFYVAFGTNKLPGNRQRVNSSGQLQFADRSLVNSTFNID
ncbi:porin, partial [Pseudoxanthomonas sp. SGD-10]